MSSEIVILNGVKYVDGIAYGPAVDMVRGPDGVLERVKPGTTQAQTLQEIAERRRAMMAAQVARRERDEAKAKVRAERRRMRQAKAALEPRA